MKHLPVKSARRAPRPRADEPASPVERMHQHGPFVSFHYAYTEVTADAERAQVRRRTTRFAEGKLTHESFHGTVDRRAYDALVQDLQRAIVQQHAAFLRMFTAFLPFGRASTRDDE